MCVVVVSSVLFCSVQFSCVYFVSHFHFDFCYESDFLLPLPKLTRNECMPKNFVFFLLVRACKLVNMLLFLLSILLLCLPLDWHTVHFTSTFEILPFHVCILCGQKVTTSSNKTHKIQWKWIKNCAIMHIRINFRIRTINTGSLNISDKLTWWYKKDV